MTYEAFVRETIEQHRSQAAVFDAYVLTGERHRIVRDVGPDLDTIWYVPEDEAGPWPALVNLHGGGFTSCDAVQTGSLCRTIVDAAGILVVNLNYRKAPEHPFPFAVNEACDLIQHLCEHADEYGIDPCRIAVAGESAGASLAIASAMKLAEERGVALAAQVLVYPCTDLMGVYTHKVDDEWLDHCCRAYLGSESPSHPYFCHLAASREQLEKVCPAIILTCENDALRQQGEVFAQRLVDACVPVAIRRFKGAEHGFLEVNRPDWGFPDERINPEQDRLAREAERYIVRQLQSLLKQ